MSEMVLLPFLCESACLWNIVTFCSSECLFKQYGKKKPCGCKDKAKVEPESEDDTACQEAVDMIMAERKKTMRITEEGFAKMRAEELEKCKNA